MAVVFAIPVLAVQIVLISVQATQATIPGSDALAMACACPPAFVAAIRVMPDWLVLCAHVLWRARTMVIATTARAFVTEGSPNQIAPSSFP